jgi:Secretion system C-terminal sorting domain
MKKIQIFVFALLFCCAIPAQATHFQVWITSAGVSVDSINAVFGDTITIHASATYPMRAMASYTDWSLGSTNGGTIRTADIRVVVQNSDHSYYFLCSNQPTNSAFKLVIRAKYIPVLYPGIKIEPCPVQNIYAPLKLYVQRDLLQSSNSQPAAGTPMYIWGWIDGVASFPDNGAWAQANPANLMTNEGNGVWSYTFPNLSAWYGGSIALDSVLQRDAGYVSFLMKTQDGFYYQTADQKVYLHYCNTAWSVGTQNISEKTVEINVFPNPSSDAINLGIDNFGGMTVEIFDALGRKCDTQYLPFGNTINVQTLVKGIYYGQIHSSSYRFRFVKE